MHRVGLEKRFRLRATLHGKGEYANAQNQGQGPNMFIAHVHSAPKKTISRVGNAKGGRQQSGCLLLVLSKSEVNSFILQK